MQYMEINHFHSRLGFSIYFSNNSADSLQWMTNYADAGFSFAFTSLNIMEEKNQQEKIHDLLSECQKRSIDLFVDINSQSLQYYGIDGLKKLGFSTLRIDDGLSNRDIYDLSTSFKIILNASTLTPLRINALKDIGVNIGQLLACHNYYPKPYTGLSVKKVQIINQLLHENGIPVIAFVPGEVKRLPIFEGLPTIEEHRNLRPLEAALECFIKAECDFVCIGDNSLSESSLNELSYLAQGIIPLAADIPTQLENIVFENRIDASDYLIRAAYSRLQLKDMSFEENIQIRKRGDIVVANEKFLRYEKELEICLRDLPLDRRQMTVGKVIKKDLPLLELVQSPFKFKFISSKEQ